MKSPEFVLDKDNCEMLMTDYTASDLARLSEALMSWSCVIDAVRRRVSAGLNVGDEDEILLRVRDMFYPRDLGHCIVALGEGVDE